MKRYYALALSSLLLSGSVFCAMTPVEVKKLKNKTEDLLNDMVSGHNRAFGANNLYGGNLDLAMWSGALANTKAFVTTVINDNKNFLGMRDSTLVNALDKITKAEANLITAIKVTRAVLSSPADLAKQVSLLNQIKADMLALQKTLSSPLTPMHKDEARKLLNSAAMFIETTASKAVRDAQKK